MAARGLRMKNPQGYRSLESIALSMRKQLAPEIDVDEALPLHDVFQRLGRMSVVVGGKARPVRYVVEEGLGYGVEALTRYDRDEDAFDVVLNGRTYDAVERDLPGRPYFTLPHEIGHLVLHTEELIELAIIPHHRALMRGGGEHRPFLDSEWQANGHGAAFAMPAAGLARLDDRGMLTPENVQATFKVSPKAAEIRISVFRERRAELMAAYHRT